MTADELDALSAELRTQDSAPSRFWERVESNPFVQALIVLCLAAVVAAQMR